MDHPDREKDISLASHKWDELTKPGARAMLLKLKKVIPGIPVQSRSDTSRGVRLGILIPKKKGRRTVSRRHAHRQAQIPSPEILGHVGRSRLSSREKLDRRTSRSSRVPSLRRRGGTVQRRVEVQR